MTRLRALTVAATIVGSIAFSLAALAGDRSLWPFPHYPMYSWRQGSTTAVTRAVGVARDGREFTLSRRIELSGLHLHIVSDNALWHADAAARISRIATAIWVEYERLRAAGEIDGPPLASVRIYRDTINLATEPHTRSTTQITRGPAP